MSALILSPTAQITLSVLDAWHRVREREDRLPNHCVAVSVALAQVLQSRGIEAAVHIYLLNIRMPNRAVRVGPVNDTFSEEERALLGKQAMDDDVFGVDYHAGVETEDFFIDPTFDQFSVSTRAPSLVTPVEPIIIPWGGVVLREELRPGLYKSLDETWGLQGDAWDFATRQDTPSPYTAFYGDLGAVNRSEAITNISEQIVKEVR